MRDYAELEDALKECCHNRSCDTCRMRPECADSGCVVEKAADAIEELLASVPHWISVEDKLPDKEGYYLVAVTNEHGRRYTKSAFFMGPQHGAWFAKQKVTHWTMPLVAPPKEDVYGD